MTKRNGIVALLAVIAVIALVLRFTVFSRTSQAERVVASGTVEATEADLGFQAAGRIERIAAREGDVVQEGVALAWLDQSELDARKRAAQAQVAAAQAQLDELIRGFRSEEVAQGRSAVRAARQRANDASRDVERARRLQAGGAISQQALDAHDTAYELAQADLESAEERLRLLESGPRTERIAAQRAVVAQAEAAVQQIDATIGNTIVRAPFAGIITVRHREPGETVAPGLPVVTLMNPNDRWVRIYVREDEVGKISIGQRASITADAYPDRTYDGEVAFIASDAEFTPRNVQTTEERVKLVYRLKVRISGDSALELKPGLAADVRLQPPAG